MQKAEAKARRALRTLRKLVRQARTQKRQKLVGIPSPDLRVPTSIGEFLDEAADVINGVDERTDCTVSGGIGTSGGHLLERSSGGIFGATTKLGKAAFKVGRFIGGWGDVVLFAGLTGVC
jgi:hypothetical protein